MAIKKIPCGGWLYDDESITFEDGVMKVVGGGFGGGAMVVTFEVDGYNLSCDKTVTEVRAAMAQGTPVIGIITEDGNSKGIGPCLVNAFSESIGFMHWISEGELKFTIEAPDDSDDWRLGV